MVAVTSIIPSSERLEKLLDVGCHDIMVMIASSQNPALPVKSEVIDKFIFRDTGLYASYNLPHQVGHSVDGTEQPSKLQSPHISHYDTSA